MQSWIKEMYEKTKTKKEIVEIKKDDLVQLVFLINLFIESPDKAKECLKIIGEK